MQNSAQSYSVNAKYGRAQLVEFCMEYQHQPQQYILTLSSYSFELYNKQKNPAQKLLEMCAILYTLTQSMCLN